MSKDCPIEIKDKNGIQLSRSKAFKRLMSLSSSEFVSIFTGLSALLINSLTNLSYPWIMGQVVDKMQDTSIPENVQFLSSAALAVAAGSIASWVRVYCLNLSTDRIAMKLRKEVFESYLEKEMEYFDELGTGEMVTVLEKDVNTAAETFTERLAAALRSLNSSLNGSILLFITSPELCWVTLGLVPLVGVSAMMISKYARKLAQKTRELESQVLSFTLERFRNISTVRLNGQEERERNSFQSFSDQHLSLNRSSLLAQGASMGFINLATNLSLGAVLLVGGRMIGRGKLTPGLLTRFAIQSAFVGLGFSGLSSVHSDVNKSLDAATKVFEVIDENKKYSKQAPPPPTPFPPPSPSSLSTLPSISIRDLSFSYQSRSSQPVLSHISLIIPAGKFTCLAGGSGNGKSTLLSLLCGLYRPTEGEIWIGNRKVASPLPSSSSSPSLISLTSDSDSGHDLNKQEKDGREEAEIEEAKQRTWLRGMVGVMEQRGGLFAGTIKENVTYAKPNATQEDIQSAITSSSLDFAHSLPNQLDTQVGEAGSLLSAGQRARVSLARALIRKPPLLLLDEPTSSLDSEAESAILNALLKLRNSGQHTILACSHSPSLLKAADHIIVLEKGIVKAQGTHEQLLRQGVL